MTGQGPSAECKGKLLSEYAARRASSSEPRNAGCVTRLLGVVAHFMRLAPLVVAVAFLLAPVRLQAQTTLTTTQQLSAVISPLGGLFTITSSVTLTTASSVFNNYTTTSPAQIQYRARTTQSSGSGSITLKVTSDFSPAGGPSVGTPPTTGDALTYTCSGATLGTCVNGTASTTSATNVVTFPSSACTGGGGSCSSANPNTVSVSFLLTNDPKYKTGSYSATATWTISAA